MSRPTMVDTHPRILAWLGSPHPLRSLPAALLVSLCLATAAAFSGPTWPVALGLALLGAFYWTFLEYAIHRWVYHRHIRNARVAWFVETFHQHHHRVMDDRRVWNAGPLMVIPLALGLLLPPALLLRDLGLLAWFGLGTLAAYYAYEWVHYAIHAYSGERGYLGYMRRYHLHHHRRVGVNFGNTSPLWDLLLGTCARVSLRRRAPAESRGAA